MARVKYKVKCCKCKKNYVLVTKRTRYPVCYQCQKKEMQGEIKDKEMKKLFDIPEDFYKKNLFLRNIKINYLKWGKLSDKQIEAFKKTVKKMKNQSS
jgi:adenylate kinase family enzyme